MIRMRTWLLLTGLAVVSRVSHGAPTDAAAPWADARQMIIVTTADWNINHGVLRTWQREATSGVWQPVGAPVDVTIGKQGSAWGVGLHPVQPADGAPVKTEGDGRSPAGVFRVGEAFGYAPTNPTALPYRGLTVSDYCVDVDNSPYYNRLVDEAKVGRQAVAGATEAMRRDLHFKGDHAYRIGFVIEHNPNGVKGAGSCIFAHLWKSPSSPTAGCTAMTDQAMERLLAWLDPKRKPVFVLLPKDAYARLQAGWRLPDPGASALPPRSAGR